jgi:hypothetical protein
MLIIIQRLPGIDSAISTFTTIVDVDADDIIPAEIITALHLALSFASNLLADLVAHRGWRCRA